MGNVVPTLSGGGWLRGMSERADALVSYFLVSDYSQSLAHLGKVKSLPYYIQQYGKDPAKLKSEAERKLSELLDAYFESASVSVTIVEPDMESNQTAGAFKPADGRLDLRFNVIVREDGKNYSLGRLVSYMNSTLSRVVDLNNA